MTYIPLEQWAFDNEVKHRTAQRWAQEKRIPVKRRTFKKFVEKTWKGYVIEESTPPPTLSR